MIGFGVWGFSFGFGVLAHIPGAASPAERGAAPSVYRLYLCPVREKQPHAGRAACNARRGGGCRSRGKVICEPYRGVV